MLDAPQPSTRQDAIWQTTTYYVMDVILLYIDHNLFKY